MVTPQSITESLSQFVNAGLMSKIMTYVGYVMIVVMILGFFYILYLFISYKYKVTYPILHYDTNGKSAQILRYKKDRARMAKHKGTKKTRLLFKRIWIEPLSDEVIKPGNRVNLFRINEDGTYTAMPSLRFDNPGQFEYLDPQEKAWAKLELKESATANQTPEAAKRIMTYMIIAVAFCLVAAIASVWIIMKAPNQVVESLNTVTPALQNIAANIGGTAPG